MPRIRRPSLTHGVAAVASILSDVSTTDFHAANPANDAAPGASPEATKPINPALVVSAKKIFKVLRALDPRADNAHRGKERVVRLNKFRSYVNGKYSPDGVSKPPFRQEDVLILFLGTKLDRPGDAMNATYIPGLLRACGTPSSNHSRASGNAPELMKKSALPAMDLLRYLVCDLHVTEANANSAVFGEVFCTLPPEELRQLRLPLHLAGFGGKREGSREDASRILTHYLLSNARSCSTSFSCADVLDELLGPAGSEARMGYGGWLLTQDKELRRAATDAGIVDVLPNKRQVGAVTLVKTDSDTPLTFAKTILEEIDGPLNDEETTEAPPRNTVAAPGPGNSRRLSDQAFGVSTRAVSAKSADVGAEPTDGMQISIEEFASLKAELAISRATVESLQTTVSRLSDTTVDLLKKDVQTSHNMKYLRQENAKMKEMLDEMLLSQNEMKSKMGLLRISKESVHGGSSDSWKNNHRGNKGSRNSLISNHDSDNSHENGNAGTAGIGMSIRNVFNSMRNEQVHEDTIGTDARSVDSLLWDD